MKNESLKSNLVVASAKGLLVHFIVKLLGVATNLYL